MGFRLPVCRLTFTHSPQSRCMAGLLNGNVGVERSMIGELSDETNVAQASGLTFLMWSIGATLGLVEYSLSRYLSNFFNACERQAR